MIARDREIFLALYYIGIWQNANKFAFAVGLAVLLAVPRILRLGKTANKFAFALG